VVYVVGSSGTAGLVGQLRVSEWYGASWNQLGGELNLMASDGPSLASRSIAKLSSTRHTRILFASGASALAIIVCSSESVIVEIRR